jgi:hypothetical protein
VTVTGFHDATRTLQTIERWFIDPDHLLAIPTGKPSGWVVVDIDGDDGWDSLRDLERDYGSLPKTASVRTPRGYHFYFKWPGAEVRCSASQVAPHIDVRGDGGYVIVPPSRGYEPDDQVAPIALPAWLHGLMTAHAANGRKTPVAEWVALVRDGAAEGHRNDQLTRLVGHLLRRNVDVDLTAELAHLVNAYRFQPPLDPGEVDRTINSIAAAELRRRAR